MSGLGDVTRVAVVVGLLAAFFLAPFTGVRLALPVDPPDTALAFFGFFFPSLSFFPAAAPPPNQLRMSIASQCAVSS